MGCAEILDFFLTFCSPDAFNPRQQSKNMHMTNQEVKTAGGVECCYKVFIGTFEVIKLLIKGKNSSSGKWQFQCVFNLSILLSFAELLYAFPLVSLL